MWLYIAHQVIKILNYLESFKWEGYTTTAIEVER